MEKKFVAHGGLPGWFRAACREAREGRGNSYAQVGRRFASVVAEAHECPDGASEDEWTADCNGFVELLLGNTPPGAVIARPDIRQVERPAWEWFASRFPRWAELVPPARRFSFIEGIRDELVDVA